MRKSECMLDHDPANLTREVVTWLESNGASAVGIASIDRFEGAPRGHHPCDLVPEANAVITFGVALLHHSMHWEGHFSQSELVAPEHRREFLQNYFYLQTGSYLVNDLLSQLALRLANRLESQGYFSLFFPPAYSPAAQVPEVNALIRKAVPSGWGLFSQRHAAVMAGLGEFGLNNLVVTPKYGPRIRFNSVITQAPLVPNPLMTEKVCLGESCSICLARCPGALAILPGVDAGAVWYVPPARTDIDACRRSHRTEFCLGRCIKHCPIGSRRLPM